MNSTACPANTYKETYSNSDQCIPCPDNSESGEAASFCTCKTEFYRSENEEITEKCTGMFWKENLVGVTAMC